MGPAKPRNLEAWQSLHQVRLTNVQDRHLALFVALKINGNVSRANCAAAVGFFFFPASPCLYARMFLNCWCCTTPSIYSKRAVAIEKGSNVATMEIYCTATMRVSARSENLQITMLQGPITCLNILHWQNVSLPKKNMKRRIEYWYWGTEERGETYRYR